LQWLDAGREVGTEVELTAALIRADLRHRWRSWLAVVVLVGLVGGLSMAAVAGWRRTSSAMERFVEYHRPGNAYVEGRLDAEDLLAIDGVTSANGGDYFLLVPVDRRGKAHPEHLGQVSPFSHTAPELGRTVERALLIDGRLPDPAVETEAIVDEEMAELYDLRPGDQLTVRGYGPHQVEDLFEGLGTLEPSGPEIDLTITGIHRLPQDVVPKQKVPEVVYLGSAEIHLGPAFDAAHRRKDILSLGALFGDLSGPGGDGFSLQVDHSAISRDRLKSEVRALDPKADLDFTGSDAVRAQQEAERTIQLQSALLLAFGALVAAGGLVIVLQALRRQLEGDRALQRSAWAFGLAGRRAMGLAAVKGLVIGLASAALAIVVAIALSPLTPVGHARRAEVDPGVAVDGAVLVVGVLALGAFLVVVPVAAAWREAVAITRRSPGRAPRVGVAERAARAGLSPPVVAGIRSALLGAGGGTVVVTVFVAAAGIVGALAFAASEDRLATEPELWGWDFDVVVGDSNDQKVDEHIEASLVGSSDIAAYAKRHELSSGSATYEGRTVELDLSAIEELKGSFAPRMLEGLAPTADDEVALGGATARRLGVEVGDRLDLEAQLGPEPFTVTGIAVMHLGLGSDRIGEGGLLHPSAIPLLIDEPDPPFVLVRYASGVDEAATYEMLQDEWGNTVLPPTRSIDVDQLHQVRFLPVWFAGLLAVVAAGTLAFVLVLTVRRRRHDLALLRTIGFERRQVRTTVLVQAFALVLPGTLAGVVIGLAAGRVIWSVTADSLGAPSVHVVPVAAAVAVLGGALLVGWLASAVPGRLAGRLHPAAILRTE
jgi:hypothetical protein